MGKSKFAKPKIERIDLIRLRECATYLIESEWDNFKEYVLEGNDPERHIYYAAHLSLHGMSHLETVIDRIESGTM